MRDTFWTDEREAALKALLGEGLSFKDIAARIGGGATKNAVLGKAHRLGIKQSASRQPVRNVRRRAAQPKTPGSTLHGGASHAAKPPRRAVARFESAPPVPEDVRPDRLLAFADLEAKSCRYIYGHPHERDHGYCPNAAVEGMSFCTFHVQKCYAPPTVRRSGSEFTFASRFRGAGYRGSRPSEKTSPAPSEPPVEAK